MAKFVEHVLNVIVQGSIRILFGMSSISFFLQVLGRIAVRDLLKMADSLIPSPLDLDLSVELDTVLHLLLITSVNIVLVAILLGRRGNTDVVH